MTKVKTIGAVYIYISVILENKTKVKIPFICSIKKDRLAKKIVS